MPVLTIFCGKQRQDISVSAGTTLLEGLRQGGFPHVEAPCGGCGRCGRCLVTAVGGLSPAGARERALLSPRETRRLACLARVEEDCTVVLPEGATRVAVEHAATGFPIDRAGRGLGAAADIGTTTVALYLYDRTPGTLLATASAPNAQRWAGADVISRIRYTMENPGGLAELTGAIRRQLRELLAQACTRAGRAAGEVTALSVAGNTVMEHLLAGLSPAGMAAAPFTPASFFGQAVPAGPYDLGMAPDAELYLFPCISGYVGGDITAGLTAVRAARAERPILFVDVGTNGEMALGGRDGLLCCSTAAGPAFEGACISCGMGAADGAIDKVWLEDGQLRCSVLGGGEPAGVCGSGLVDALAVLLALEVVDETGRLLPADEAPPAWAGRIEGDGNGTRFRLAGNVWLTSGDVRQLQLAKAAVSAGIQTLLAEAGVAPEELSAFYLAGGFGSYLRPESAAAIGLFPDTLLDRLHVAGNSAGAGSSAVLLSTGAEKLLTETVERCRYLELSGLPRFNSTYLDCMSFE